MALALTDVEKNQLAEETARKLAIANSKEEVSVVWRAYASKLGTVRMGKLLAQFGPQGEEPKAKEKEKPRVTTIPKLGTRSLAPRNLV